MSPRKDQFLDPSKSYINLLVPPTSNDLSKSGIITPKSPQLPKGPQAVITTFKKTNGDEKKSLLTLQKIPAADSPTPRKKKMPIEENAFIRPDHPEGKKTVAELIDQVFGPRSKSSVASYQVPVPAKKPSKPPEDKSALYYDKLDMRMRVEEDDELWKYVYFTPTAELKEQLQETLKSTRSSSDIKTYLLSKRPAMIFTHLLKEYSQNKLLPALKLKDSPTFQEKSVESKMKVGAKRTDYNPLSDNLEQTGASLIANYIKKTNEQRIESSALPNQNLMLMSSFLFKKINNSRGSMALSFGLFNSSTLVPKQPSGPSNLEHIQNNQKTLKAHLKKCISYEHEQKLENKNVADLCYIEHNKIGNSSLGKVVCGQFFKISSGDEGLFTNYNPSAWNYIREGTYITKEHTKQSKKTGFEASTSHLPITNFPQKVLVAKFSPDSYSLALGCSDGCIIILQYNNENTKWDFFQSNSLVLGRQNNYDGASYCVVDFAWSMVSCF